MGKVVAVCNQKGGVGKTTLTYFLGLAAAEQGKRVLVVDMDPQGNLSALAAREAVAPDEIGVADALSDRTTEALADVIVPGVVEGLDLAPTSGPELGVVRDELIVKMVGREFRLRTVLEPVRDTYDLILLDCAPSLDQLTVNGMTAADGVVLVTQTKLLSINGLAQVLDTIEQVKTHYNPPLKIVALIGNLHEERTKSGTTWWDELTQAAQARDLPLLAPPVPKRAVINDVAESGATLADARSIEADRLAHLFTDYLSTIEKALA